MLFAADDERQWLCGFGRGSATDGPVPGLQTMTGLPPLPYWKATKTDNVLKTVRLYSSAERMDGRLEIGRRGFGD